MACAGSHALTSTWWFRPRHHSRELPGRHKWEAPCLRPAHPSTASHTQPRGHTATPLGFLSPSYRFKFSPWQTDKFWWTLTSRHSLTHLVTHTGHAVTIRAHLWQGWLTARVSTHLDTLSSQTTAPRPSITGHVVAHTDTITQLFPAPYRMAGAMVTYKQRQVHTSGHTHAQPHTISLILAQCPASSWQPVVGRGMGAVYVGLLWAQEDVG